jgi:heptaprenylglyceryl phosphate synthase
MADQQKLWTAISNLTKAIDMVRFLAVLNSDMRYGESTHQQAIKLISETAGMAGEEINNGSANQD